MGRIKVKDHSLLQSDSFRFYTNLGLCPLLCPEKGTEILVLTHKDQGNQELNIQDYLFKLRYRTFFPPRRLGTDVVKSLVTFALSVWPGP